MTGNIFQKKEFFNSSIKKIAVGDANIKTWRTGMSCSACACSDMDIHGSDNKVRFGFQIRDTAAFLVAYCCGILNAYMYPSWF